MQIFIEAELKLIGKLKERPTQTVLQIRKPCPTQRMQTESLADVSALGANSHVVARDFNANVVRARFAGNVVAEVILVSEVHADLIQYRRDRFSLRNIEGAAGAEIGK